MRLPLFLLGLGTFTVGTCELVIAGLLPLVAADLQVSVPAAGQLVTGYAFGFGVGAPIVASLTGQAQRKRLLLYLLGAFAVGNALAAVAPSYGLLLVARVVVACLAGTYEVVATTAAAALVPPERRGRAIAVVLGGFSVALVLGVPLGTLLGQAAGWRSTFVALAVAGAVVTASSALWLPRLGGHPSSAGASATADPPTTTGAAWMGLLKRRDLLPAFGVTGLLFTGQYLVATYLAPALQARAGLEGAGIAATLFILGAASAAGNVGGGYATDRWGVRSTTLVALAVLALALSGFSLLGTSAVGAALTIGATGGAIGAFMPAWQYRLVTLAPRASELVLALNLSALNGGIALGAALGGLLVDRGGLSLLGLAGGAAALAALALAVPILRVPSRHVGHGSQVAGVG